MKPLNSICDLMKDQLKTIQRCVVVWCGAQDYKYCRESISIGLFDCCDSREPIPAGTSLEYHLSRRGCLIAGCPWSSLSVWRTLISRGQLGATNPGEFDPSFSKVHTMIVWQMVLTSSDHDLNDNIILPSES